MQVAGEDPRANGPSELSPGRPLYRLSNRYLRSLMPFGFRGRLVGWTGYTVLETCTADY